jgi:ADP-heptose:LPS heptosyltransferase
MKYERILIVALTRMGDLLQSSPTIVGLKKENPDSKITILVDTQFASICRGIPGIDEVYLLDMNYIARGISAGGEGLVETFGYVSQLVDDLKQRNFDYCLNMSNSAYTALLIKMLNVPKSKGWLSDDEGFRLMADPWAMLFSAFVYHSNRDFNGLNLVDIFRCAAEVTEHPWNLAYTVAPGAREKITSILPESFLESESPLIAIQVGASQEKRQWAPKHFAKLTQYLIEDLDANIVYTGAPSEVHLIEAVQTHFTHEKVFSVVGKTSIEELGAILDACDVLVTGDTGPMHLSVAVGTPVVALFLASALVFETGPYSVGNFVVQPQIGCNPCNPNYPCARPDCHDYVSPELMAYLTRLRIQTPIENDGYIQIPQDIAPPGQVRIYRSDFDKNGYLEFIEMNGDCESNGYEKGYLKSARAAYRLLWKEEFSGISPEKNSINTSVKPCLKEEVEDMLQVCSDACKSLERLKKVASDPSIPAKELEHISVSLTRYEQLLEQLSLTFPILGAIIRIFIMEKENLRGEDIFKLTDESLVIYQTLERRLLRFQKYFSHFSNVYMEQEIEEHVANNG